LSFSRRLVLATLLRDVDRAEKDLPDQPDRGQIHDHLNHREDARHVAARSDVTEADSGETVRVRWSAPVRLIISPKLSGSFLAIAANGNSSIGSPVATAWIKSG
jgi:hypothetical protein